MYERDDEDGGVYEREEPDDDEEGGVYDRDDPDEDERDEDEGGL